MANLPANPRPDRAEARELLTRLDELQRRVDGLSAELHEAERAATLGTVAGLLAHEFNNLLTPVQTYAQLALEQPQDAELQRRALRLSAQVADRASGMTQAILSFLRPGQSAGPARASVLDATRDAVLCLGREPSRDGIRLSVEVDPALHVGVPAVVVQHILLNILLNARRALIPGGGSVSVRAGRVREDGKTDSVSRGTDPRGGDWVEIVVRDSGPGLPAFGTSLPAFGAGQPTRRDDMIPESGGYVPAGAAAAAAAAAGVGVGVGVAAEPVAGTLRTPGGRGLGLTVCARLAASVGGWFEIGPTGGPGATFRVVLPGSGPG